MGHAVDYYSVLMAGWEVLTCHLVVIEHDFDILVPGVGLHGIHSKRTLVYISNLVKT
jgi:hypothetical protein